MDLETIADHNAAVSQKPLRRAGVLVPVLDSVSTQRLVFIRRADDLSEHPGEMSFPGGGYEPADENRQGTAIRESREEIGLEPAEITLFGRLDDIRTVTGYTVSPFVARVPDRTYKPTDSEVAEVVTLPVPELTAAENHSFEPRDHPDYGTVPCHHFRVDGYTIWGATARMLVQLLSLATDWEAPEPPTPSLGELLHETD